MAVCRARKPRTLSNLPAPLRRNVLIAAADKGVQKAIVNAMFACMERCDTGASDIMEYIDIDSLENDNTRMALFGKFENEDDEEDLTCVNCDPDAIMCLIKEVRQRVLHTLSGTDNG